MDGTNGVISIPLDTGSNTGLKEIGIFICKSGDEVTNARSEINTTRCSESHDGLESQVGGLGLGLGLHASKNLLHQVRVPVPTSWESRMLGI